MKHTMQTDARLALFIGSIFAALSLLCGCWSMGFLEADGITHYMYARFAFSQPQLLVDVWGRPVVTMLDAPFAALGGLFATRCVSLALVLGCGWTAWKLADGLGHRRPLFAFAATLASPLAFLHSFAVLTELPFAFLVGIAALAYLRRWWWTLAIIAGLMPATRPEGIPIAIGVLGVLLLHRRWWAAPWVLLPAVIWWQSANWLNAPLRWPYQSESLYDPGPWWHFLVCMPAIVGPAMMAPLILGLRPGPTTDKHRRNVQRLVTLLPLAVLLGHSALYAFGKMASNGELRYLLVMLPLWGVLCGRGWDRLECRLTALGRPAVVCGMTLLGPAMMLQPFYWQVLPLEADKDWQAAEQFAAWYRGLDDRPPLLFSHPLIGYQLDEPLWPHSADKWRTAEPGTLLIFDGIYSRYNADEAQTVDAAELDRWEPIRVDVALPETWQIYRRSAAE